MLWMVKGTDKGPLIQRAGGLTLAESDLAAKNGWKFFWATERRAHEYGMKIARENGWHGTD